jgi:GrpB-like predicted nucleotidyltransferase (UPF0157 family)
MSDVEFIGGKEKRELIFSPYSDEWPVIFENESQKIANALGADALRIDHIGSTSIQGLLAKPVIDIQLSVKDPDSESSYLPMLEDVGYQLRVREQGHRMLRAFEPMVIQIHVCQTGSGWERRHLLFRDWLRQNEEDKNAYARLKVSLQKIDWETLDDYADAKGPIIAEITERAEKWAKLVQWAPSQNKA